MVVDVALKPVTSISPMYMTPAAVFRIVIQDPSSGVPQLTSYSWLSVAPVSVEPHCVTPGVLALALGALPTHTSKAVR